MPELIVPPADLETPEIVSGILRKLETNDDLRKELAEEYAHDRNLKYTTGAKMIDFALAQVIEYQGEQKYGGTELSKIWHLVHTTIMELDNLDGDANLATIDLLHDLVEDTRKRPMLKRVTLDDIARDYPEPVCIGVEGMTYIPTEEEEDIKKLVSGVLPYNSKTRVKALHIYEEARQGEKVDQARGNPLSHRAKWVDAKSHLGVCEKYPRPGDPGGDFSRMMYSSSLRKLAVGFPSVEVARRFILERYGAGAVAIGMLSEDERGNSIGKLAEIRSRLEKEAARKTHGITLIL